MCQRFQLSSPIETLFRRYQATGGIPYPPRPNIRPGEPVVIVRLKPGIEARGEREVALARWGLIPHWVKDPREFGTLINARGETLAEKPSFKAPLRHRRCIVPADGWYVWTGKTGRKVAHLIRPADPAAAPLALAALWDHWLGSDGSEIDTLAIVTIAASGALAALDERMPVALSPAAAAAWLDVRGTGPDAAADLLKPCPDTELAIDTVASRLDDPTKSTPDVL